MIEDKKEIKQLVIKKYSGILSGGLSCSPTGSRCAPVASTESLLETGRRLVRSNGSNGTVLFISL